MNCATLYLYTNLTKESMWFANAGFVQMRYDTKEKVDARNDGSIVYAGIVSLPINGNNK